MLKINSYKDYITADMRVGVTGLARLRRYLVLRGI